MTNTAIMMPMTITGPDIMMNENNPKNVSRFHLTDSLIKQRDIFVHPGHKHHIWGKCNLFQISIDF